jgi:hypothetical protein
MLTGLLFVLLKLYRVATNRLETFRMMQKINVASLELYIYLKREIVKVFFFFFLMIWMTYCLFLLLDATALLKMATPTTQVCVFCMWQKQ